MTLMYGKGAISLWHFDHNQQPMSLKLQMEHFQCLENSKSVVY